MPTIDWTEKLDSSALLLIGIVAVTVIGLIALLVIIRKKRRKVAPVSSENQAVSVSETAASLSSPTPSPALKIDFGEVESISLHDQSRLVEIKDKKLLNRIDSVIPGTAQAVINSAVVQNYSNAVASSGTLYQAIIPQGAKLSRSLNMDGASRGFYRGGNGIKGHANLVAVDNNFGDGLAVANTVNALMGVASMVVGQYYMTQINNRLDVVSKQLDRIKSFQDNEFKAKICALVAAVQKSSIFQYEILQDNDVRNRELMHLKTLEHECAELLGQVNMTIKENSQDNGLKYGDYEACVNDLQSYLEYQEVLLDLMGKIAELTYTLNLGAITRENAFAMCEPYTTQARAALDALYWWHQSRLEQFGIIIHESKRKRKGLGAAMMSIPAMFNEKLRYKGISESTSQMIIHQISAAAETKFFDGPDLYQSNVRLIAKDGKLYYLPAE